MKGNLASLTKGRERLQAGSAEFSKLGQNWWERGACTPWNLYGVSMQLCANCIYGPRVSSSDKQSLGQQLKGILAGYSIVE